MTLGKVPRLFVFLALPILSSPVLSKEGNAERGREAFFASCGGSCHAIGCNRKRYGKDWTPRLAGVIGREAGSLSDFSGYSTALRESGIVWTIQNLNQFLSDPAGMVPGVLGMATPDSSGQTAAVKDPQLRADLIAFISSGDTSQDLCP